MWRILVGLVGCTGGGPPVEVEPALAVAVTDFAVGGVAFASVDLEVGTPVFATTGDPLIRAIDGRVYVVERGGADVVSALDPGQPEAPVWQAALPRGANAHDLVALDGLLWAPAFDQPTLFALSPDDGRIVHSLDLSEFADADGLPELDAAVAIDGLLYVAAQWLERPSFGSTEGRLLVIDPSGPSVVAQHVVGPNPRIVGSGSTLLVSTGLLATPNTLERASDGRLERFDPRDGSLTVIAEEASRGADFWQAIPVDRGLVMLENLPDGQTGVFCLIDGELTEGPVDAAWFVRGVRWGDEVVIGARTGLFGDIPSQRGLLSLDPQTCTGADAYAPTPLDPYDLAPL